MSESAEDANIGWGSNDRVTSAILIVPRNVTRQIFDIDTGKILDRRLETLQGKCACTFRLSRLRPEFSGSKVCDRVHVKFQYPTKNHEVTVRLFNELAQQCANTMNVKPFIKVCRIERITLDSMLKEAAEKALGDHGTCTNVDEATNQVNELYKEFQRMKVANKNR